MNRQLGIRARFTLLYGAALIVMVLLVSAGIYFFVQRALMGQVENHLRKDSLIIQEYLIHDRGGLAKLADRGPILLFSVSDNGAPLIASDDWRSANMDRLAANRVAGEQPFSVQYNAGTSYRMVIGTLLHQNHAYRITVAHDEVRVRQTMKTLALIILLILPLSVMLSLAIGYLIAGRVLAPIGAIVKKAEEISAENLSQRLPVGENQDEFSRLALVFNQTFARIEESFMRLKRFTADASHELRTPLAAIRSIGETALHQPGGSGDDCREAIGSILEETDRLRQMIDSLLLLSRADSSEIELQHEPVDLGELVRESVELLNVLAEEKRQTIQLSATTPAVVTADRATIRQALINLLDNAIKYSPDESTIAISVGRTEAHEPYVSIKDSGIGIPQQDLALIFDRFYRVDQGRSRDAGGTGLGLSIARWAVEANHGRIDIKSEAGLGSEFRIVLPH